MRKNGGDPPWRIAASSFLLCGRIYFFVKASNTCIAMPKEPDPRT